MSHASLLNLERSRIFLINLVPASLDASIFVATAAETWIDRLT